MKKLRKKQTEFEEMFICSLCKYKSNSEDELFNTYYVNFLKKHEGITYRKDISIITIYVGVDIIAGSYATPVNTPVTDRIRDVQSSESGHATLSHNTLATPAATPATVSTQSAVVVSSQSVPRPGIGSMSGYGESQQVYGADAGQGDYSTTSANYEPLVFSGSQNTLTIPAAGTSSPSGQYFSNQNGTVQNDTPMYFLTLIYREIDPEKKKLKEKNKKLKKKQKKQDKVIKKLNKKIKGLKSGSKAGELVCFYLINCKARATQEIEKLKADRQSLVQRSNENLTKARQKNIDLVTKNIDLGKQIAALQVVTLR